MKQRGVNILTINLLFSTLIFAIAVLIYVAPRLGQLGFRPRLV